MWLKSSDYVQFIIITNSHNAIKPKVLSIEAQQPKLVLLKVENQSFWQSQRKPHSSRTINMTQSGNPLPPPVTA